MEHRERGGDEARGLRLPPRTAFAPASRRARLAGPGGA
jgi:hypothetical protein